MVTTDHPEWAEKVALLRLHGSHPKYYHKIIGINSRLDALQAAILLAKMKHLDKWTRERQSNAGRYDALFGDLLPSGLEIQIPYTQYRNHHIFHQYVIRTPKRDALRKFLVEEGVGTEIYYPVPLHLQECYAFLGHRRGDFPASERAADETLALPIFPELAEDQQAYVVDRIKAFFQK